MVLQDGVDEMLAESQYQFAASNKVLKETARNIRSLKQIEAERKAKKAAVSHKRK